MSESIDLRALLAESGVGEVLDELDRELVGLAPVKTRLREIASLLVVDKARAAIARLREMRTYAEPAGPVRLELVYKNYTPAEMMAYLPGVERVDAHTIRYTGRSILDIPRFIQVATGYRADLTP